MEEHCRLQDARYCNQTNASDTQTHYDNAFMAQQTNSVGQARHLVQDKLADRLVLRLANVRTGQSGFFFFFFFLRFQACSDLLHKHLLTGISLLSRLAKHSKQPPTANSKTTTTLRRHKTTVPPQSQQQQQQQQQQHFL